MPFFVFCCILKSPLSNMSIATLAFLSFLFAWNIFSISLTCSMYVSLPLKWVSCKQHIDRSFQLRYSWYIILYKLQVYNIVIHNFKSYTPFTVIKYWLYFLLIGQDPDAGKRLNVVGEGGDRGWNRWTALLTQWTWVRENSGRQ